MTYTLSITIYGCKRRLSTFDEIDISNDLIESLDADEEQDPDFDYMEEDEE